jgi:hypothetical protein
MLDLTPYGRLAEFVKLTDKLIDATSKDALAQAARMLAVQCGHYQRKFGVLPFDEAMDLLASENPCRRHSSLIGTPLSASFRNLMICSSVYRFFMSNLHRSDSKPYRYSERGDVGPSVSGRTPNQQEVVWTNRVV